MTHFDNQGPISNQAVNLYFSGGAHLSIRTKIAQSGYPSLKFGDIAAVFSNLILYDEKTYPTAPIWACASAMHHGLMRMALSDTKLGSNSCEYGLAHVPSVRT
jgi:hypothetical protein